jgi:hypothetical protein
MRARFKREEYLNGIVAATVRNSGFREFKEVAIPEDYLLMDSRNEPEEAKTDPRDFLQALMAAFPGATHIGNPEDVLG